MQVPAAWAAEVPAVSMEWQQLREQQTPVVVAEVDIFSPLPVADLGDQA
jgi:bifunctional pyridoxal-dependent enzyme with beta-cystathionase and maltose regulon repressor activities